MNKRRKYLRLLFYVIEDLTTAAVDTAVWAGHEASTTMLNNVHIGRNMNLKHLVALVGFGLLYYYTAEELLPASTKQMLFQ
jgi:hypothetical protein